ncbi:hypothetical protein JYU34_011880 [Plutella xylostella]|uniref:adenosine deaminase n=1 Tax=Plutella xylostella TaxID=51655 RepID=A0ABQ7QDU1_PLUXY|nr:hypothetical protein JYU34_011880 [Plutella xylostella]
MKGTVPLLFSFLFATVIGLDEKHVIREKANLLAREVDMMVGSDITFTDNEEKANAIVMDMKMKEIDDGFNYPQFFNLSKHFFKYKDDVKESPLFQVIKSMPKGAVLHAHDTGLLSPDYVVNITYSDDLYVCFVDEDISFLFSENEPEQPCETQWLLMRDARYSSGNVEKFDAHLRKHFTVVVDNPSEAYPDVNAAWNKFGNYFVKTSGLFGYKPIWEMYFYDTLKAFREDNIMYIEIRSVLPPLYDLKGITYDAVQTAKSYKKMLDRFILDYPDFFGARLIYAPIRLVSASTVEEYLETAKIIKAELPDFFAGFDLVGQEDLGVPLKEFVPQLSAGADELDYFFHAGETNWFGTTTDDNLFDAVALGTKRIGHAFALAKHPVLLQEVKRRNIGLEINVISNNVLKLVDDIRNHPLASFLAQGLPVVISSDDPGVWEADPLSHDFYVAFVGVSSRNADLRLLKKLALNSLYHSTAPYKDKMIYEFEKRWSRFIDGLVRRDNEGEL